MADTAADDDLWGTLGAKPAARASGAKPAEPAANDDALWSTLGNRSATAAPRVPAQSMGPIPEGDPVGQSTGTPIQEGRVPGFVTQAIGGLPTDPEQKRRIIAKQLFPDLDLKAAEARIFPGVNGRLAAVGLDGVPFYIEPAAGGTATDPYSPGSIAGTFRPTDIGARAGSVVGPAMPAAGGVAGGALASPSSIVVGPLAAAGGAAAGDALRQFGARYFDPTPGATPYNALQTGGEAIGAGVGQLFGAGFLRTFATPRLGINVGELPPGVMQDASRVNQLAQDMNVTHLTPGMLTGAPSLLTVEDAVASGAAGRAGTDIAGGKYNALRDELRAAYERNLLDPISSAADKTDAAMQFQQGAEDARRIVRQQANAAARPSYEAAERGGQVMSPDLAQLMDNPAVQEAMTAARKEYLLVNGKAAPDSPDFELWDLTKRKLDFNQKTAQKAGDNTLADALDDVRTRLLTNLDAAYPTYETARATSAPGQRLAARLKGSTGSAVGAGTERAESIVKPIFEGNNPRAIAEARAAFAQAGREEEWNAGTRSYLQSVFDNASKSQDGLNPSMLRMQLWAKPGVRDAMRAAMSPEAFQGLENYMVVLEAASRAKGINSLTAPRQATAAELAQAAETGGASALRFMGRTAQDLPNPFRGFGIGSAIKSGFDALADKVNARNMRTMMSDIFSPEGMEFLRRMAEVSPMSEKALAATTEFIGQQGADRRIAPPRQNALAAGLPTR